MTDTQVLATPKQLVWILVLVIIAGVTRIWFNNFREDVPVRPLVDVPAASYTLDDFVLDAMDDNGRLAFQMRAPRLEQQAGDGGSIVTSPDIVLFELDEAVWHITAHEALISADAKRMELKGAVFVERETERAQEALEIRTDFMTLYPRRKLIHTDAEVEIQQPRLILTGVRLRANLRSETIRILQEVKAHYATPAPE